MPKRYISRKTARFHLKLHTKFLNLFELRKNLDVKKETQDFMNYGLIVDISECGICILTTIVLNSDDFLELNFTLPMKEKNESMKLKGIVRWSRQKNSNEYSGERYHEYSFCSGIEFLKDAPKEHINKFILYWKSLGMDKREK